MSTEKTLKSGCPTATPTVTAEELPAGALLGPEPGGVLIKLTDTASVTFVGAFALSTLALAFNGPTETSPARGRNAVAPAGPAPATGGMSRSARGGWPARMQLQHAQGPGRDGMHLSTSRCTY